MKNRIYLGIILTAGAMTWARASADQADNPPVAQVLSGSWRIATDPQNTGRDAKWFGAIPIGSVEAPVPGIIQEVFPGYHGVAWYWRPFRIKPRMAVGGRIFIRFGAVDYLADVWINGAHAGSFEGGETPFEFDITDLVKPDGENLVAVRVLNPTNDSIDGVRLDETPHRNKVMKPRAGSSFNSGGIMYPVELRFLPAVNIADLFVQPDPQSGRITAMLTIRNAGLDAQSGILSLSVSPAAGGDELGVVHEELQFAPGTTTHPIVLAVSQPRLWNLDDPFLYRVSATVSAAGQRSHQSSVRCGFRDFRIKDGWFYLNGQRIFVKSTHTGNHMPIGQQLATVADFVRRDMINAKASGFNTVRFISGVGFPEQLDFCDELGLMVYEECYASWLLADSPKMKERFDRNTSDMVLRDRNHPSVAIWGLLNETGDGPVFRHAVEFLPKLRALDTTRLVLLSSGRWDGHWSIGSVSNPGGSSWEQAWGIEATEAATVTGKTMGYIGQTGDVHAYPAVPHTPATEKFFRNLGHESKPVFVSEYGVGSMFDVIGEHLHFEEAGAREDLEDNSWLKRQSEALAADWKRLGFDDVYAFPEDLLRESQRLNARQRTLGFDLIRSNPKINGYSLSGMLDHGYTGEGLWTFWREWKPETFDAVSDGWSPLRWCLFSDTMHTYSGRDITLEAVLANEEILKPGDYPARFRLMGPSGVAWEKSTVVNVPRSDPLAIPVIRTTFRLEGPPGRYTFAAALEGGGAPTGSHLEIQVSDRSSLPGLTGNASTWGLDAHAQEWLSARGLAVRPMSDTVPADETLLLVGSPENADNPRMWEGLKSRMNAGATVIFLSPDLFIHHSDALAWLPLKNHGRCYTFADWMYHKECVTRRHPVFDGLQAPGIMDAAYYGPVIPHEVFEGIDTPDDTMAAAFATGYYGYPDGYGCSIVMGGWSCGKGRFVLSTPYILKNLDGNPAADRLLVNLVLYSQKQSARAASPR